ncbi:MAG: hypothetical protein ACI30I_09000 [Parabacteroides sp.]
MLYNKRKYSKAFVGNNLVHTGTTLYNYINFQQSGYYLIVKAESTICNSLDFRFRVYYRFDFVSTSDSTNHRYTQTYEEKYGYISRLNNTQQILLTPGNQPDAPSGYTLSSYSVLDLGVSYYYPQSDELYTYQFRNMT